MGRRRLGLGIIPFLIGARLSLSVWKTGRPTKIETTTQYRNVALICRECALTDADLVARVLLDDDHHAFAELVRQSSIEPSEVCFASLPALMSRSPMIWRRKPFCAPTRTSAAFAGKRSFRPGSIESPTTAFAKMRARRKELVGIDEAQLEAEHDPQTVDPALRHDLMHALQLTSAA